VAIPVPDNPEASQVARAPELQTAEELDACRRGRADRRAHPTPMLSRYTLFGRRRTFRRLQDLHRPAYIDLPHGVHLYALLLMVLLIAVDTFSTLYILSQGGTEANPLMQWFLDQGTGWFILAKLGTAVVGFILLGVHQYVRAARNVVGLLILAYFALAVYHLYLLVKFLY
jgi:hypothetical protein